MKYRSQRLKPILTVMAIPFAVVFFIIASQAAAKAAQPMVAAGRNQTVGLKSDGTVVAVGYNNYGLLNVSSWTDIEQVATGGYHTVGLKSDGTVVAVGWNDYGQLNVSSWTDIEQVAACDCHTVGLKSDGMVVAVGDNMNGQLNVSSWTDIEQVAAGVGHTVGLKSDGTVVAVGSNGYGQLNVGIWTNIVQVAAGYFHTVGLKSDGTVVAVGDNDDGQLNVSSWTDIVQVAAGLYHTVGLKSDGTVVAVGSNSDGQLNVSSWTDIEQMAAGRMHTVGLKSDGTVVAVGYNEYGQCDVCDWDLTVSTDPVPGIKANGQDGPLFVTPSESVNISISLDPGNKARESSDPETCDWWIGALTPYGNYWLSLWGWLKYDWPISIGQIPLFDLPETELLNTPLPPGIYTFFFVLDNNPNGFFDEMTWYDYVVVIVSSGGLGHDMQTLPDFDALFQEKIKELMRE